MIFLLSIIDIKGQFAPNESESKKALTFFKLILFTSSHDWGDIVLFDAKMFKRIFMFIAVLFGNI